MLSDQLDAEKLAETNFFSVLKSSDVGRRSAVGQRLQNRYKPMETDESINNLANKRNYMELHGT